MMQVEIPHNEWVFAGGLGERDPRNTTEQDILSTIVFDKTGEYLSVGDFGGRVIIFKRVTSNKSSVEDF
jgi:serine/threonine-protein phosphatase 2A regulatory subunit B